jgi:hypothetical protein
MKANCVALGAYMIKQSSSDHILNAISNFRHILNAHKATFDTSIMLLEQTQMRQTGNQPIGFASP